MLGDQITLAHPDYYDLPPDQVYAPGAVEWANTLFEQGNICVDPTLWEFGLDTNGLNVDLAFTADNNLFRGGLWFVLGPIPASTGNWSLTDNLFDKVNFVQDTNAPLDFSNNAYWPLTDSELAGAFYNYRWNLNNASRLLPTVSGGGDNEQALAAAPPYQAGPLGRHYLPATAPLFGAGSRTPAEAGLYHYTTRTNQMKEGEEAAGHRVNTGLHYAATAGPASAMPRDSDQDGIPDYVETWHGDGNYSLHTDSETDWQDAQAVSGLYDKTNSI